MDLYQGLRQIEDLGLPHPIWRFVSVKEDLRDLSKISAYAGWTIRTIKVSKGVYKNYYANWLNIISLNKSLVAFQRKLKGQGLFIIYPSWRWRKGGTLLVDEQGATVEAVKGEIVALARQGQVMARYYCKKNKKLKLVYGKNILNSQEKKYLNKAIASVELLPNQGYYGEWAVSTKGKFMFYRLNDLVSEGQYLLKKYG
ncbi:hypothetical protein KKC17_01600 [Patescibacteria group bacterium]|nr:hypothetical protein [Patescibacteria group bacterium]